MPVHTALRCGQCVVGMPMYTARLCGQRIIVLRMGMWLSCAITLGCDSPEMHDCQSVDSNECDRQRLMIA